MKLFIMRSFGVLAALFLTASLAMAANPTSDGSGVSSDGFKLNAKEDEGVKTEGQWQYKAVYEGKAHWYKSVVYHLYYGGREITRPGSGMNTSADDYKKNHFNDRIETPWGIMWWHGVPVKDQGQGWVNAQKKIVVEGQDINLIGELIGPDGQAVQPPKEKKDKKK